VSIAVVACGLPLGGRDVSLGQQSVEARSNAPSWSEGEAIDTRWIDVVVLSEGMRRFGHGERLRPLGSGLTMSSWAGERYAGLVEREEPLALAAAARMATAVWTRCRT